VIAVPAAAHSTFAPTRESLCFASGATTYQIARNAPAPMQLVDRAELADFVLVDDFSGREQTPCRSATPIRTVTVDADMAKPDVTIALSADSALPDYKIYVHSVRFSQQEAAALLAAMWKVNQQREATGSIR
jgi:hypothetical protein